MVTNDNAKVPWAQQRLHCAQKTRDCNAASPRGQGVHVDEDLNAHDAIALGAAAPLQCRAALYGPLGPGGA